MAPSLLTPLIHGRARLLILSFLLRAPRAHTFIELRNALDFTDGSLSINLGKLEAGGLVRVQKSFVGKKPQTSVRVTAKGKREFQNYLVQLQGILPEL